MISVARKIRAPDILAMPLFSAPRPLLPSAPANPDGLYSGRAGPAWTATAVIERPGSHCLLNFTLSMGASSPRAGLLSRSLLRSLRLVMPVVTGGLVPGPCHCHCHGGLGL
jgi:hypothetical protein